MAYIAVPIPSMPGKQDIEIEVSINGLTWPGQKQTLHYRVEVFYWADCPVPTSDRVECIRFLLSTYDRDWSLYYIGTPTDDFVPIAFVKKKTSLSSDDCATLPDYRCLIHTDYSF